MVLRYTKNVKKKFFLNLCYSFINLKSTCYFQLKKEDVFMNVRMCSALENENEPTWKEVKTMKEILGGCSPNSPEGIELNLARATKSGGLKIDDLRAALTAQKTMAALAVNPVQMAQIMNIQKVIAENGVPAVEIARVLQDGTIPLEPLKELAKLAEDSMAIDYKEQDVDAFCKLYDNLRLKSNIPLEVSTTYHAFYAL